MENYRKKIKIENCTICKLSSKEIHPKYLEVDHINKNREDNRIQNLQVLCKFCHMIKSRFENKKNLDSWEIFTYGTKLKIVETKVYNLAKTWIDLQSVIIDESIFQSIDNKLQKNNFTFYDFIEEKKVSNIKNDKSELQKYIDHVKNIQLVIVECFRFGEKSSIKNIKKISNINKLKEIEQKRQNKDKEFREKKERDSQKLINFIDQKKRYIKNNKMYSKENILSDKFNKLVEFISYEGEDSFFLSKASDSERWQRKKNETKDLFTQQNISIFDLNKNLSDDLPKKVYKEKTHHGFLLSNVIHDEAKGNKLFITFKNIEYHTDFKFHWYEDYYFRNFIHKYTYKIYGKKLSIYVREPVLNDSTYLVNGCVFGSHEFRNGYKGYHVSVRSDDNWQLGMGY